MAKAGATVKHAANKSIQGDLHAAGNFIDHIGRSEESATPGTGSLQIGVADFKPLPVNVSEDQLKAPKRKTIREIVLDH